MINLASVTTSEKPDGRELSLPAEQPGSHLCCVHLASE